MDKTQDVILGVLGTQWERSRPGGLESYLESIKRSGFSGRKVMIVWDIHPYTREQLLKSGFELIDVPSPPEAFFKARMRVCYEYLKDHYKEFRYIFWLDVKDLVIQSDPSVWMEENKGNASIIASTECVTIEQEETNQMWARSILGEERYQEIKDQEVINGGTWAGEAEAMAELFHQVHLGCLTYSGGYPPCQIWINYVLHTALNKDMRIPRWSEGFAACLHPCWSPWRTPCWPHMRDQHPVLDIKTCTLHAGTAFNEANPMVVFNPLWGDTRKIEIVTPSHPLSGLECVSSPTSKAFSIVHGYDRDWDVKSMFEYTYSRPEGFDLEKFKSWNEEAVRHMPPRRRGLRRVVNAVPSSVSQLPQPGRIFQRRT